MTPIAALAAILSLLLLAAIAGALLRRRSPRVVTPGPDARVDLDDFAEFGDLAAPGTPTSGGRGTVVQFSTEYCARCPGVRRTLSALVEDRRALQFVHVDVTHRPDLAKKYGLLQTPTVLLIDAIGTPRARLSGPLSRAVLSDALNTLTGGTP